jgi:hypothetical protein
VPVGRVGPIGFAIVHLPEDPTSPRIRQHQTSKQHGKSTNRLWKSNTSLPPTATPATGCANPWQIVLPRRRRRATLPLGVPRAAEAGHNQR